MPTLLASQDLTVYYEDDCFCEPWRKPEAVLMIHGGLESGEAWFAWVPHLARHFRVLRPDIRGYGRSTVPDTGYPWSYTAFVDDLSHFLDRLGVERVHVVGTKLGGNIAIHFAATQPRRTRSLTLVRGETRGLAPRKLDVEGMLGTLGVEGYTKATQRSRLGTTDEAMARWWTEYEARAPEDVAIGISRMALGPRGAEELEEDLSRIKAPTLVFTSDHGQVADITATETWDQQIPGAEVVVVKSDGYHIAVTNADEIATRTVAFLRDLDRSAV